MAIKPRGNRINSTSRACWLLNPVGVGTVVLKLFITGPVDQRDNANQHQGDENNAEAEAKDEVIELSYVVNAAAEEDCSCKYDVHFALTGVPEGSWTLKLEGLSTEVTVD